MFLYATIFFSQSNNCKQAITQKRKYTRTKKLLIISQIILTWKSYQKHRH
uniref:Uncharacterized protein n=1 Tax=Octopus bimaculoides TaxID=37653 RepID=A0A0L8GYX6_OCTBM